MPQTNQEREQPRPSVESRYAFALEEQSRSEQRAQKDREDRNIEINGNGVWMVDHICPLCGNNMMWNGSSTKPRVWCPRCDVQITKAGLVKIFPGLVA
jgi:rubrerythrin